MEIYSTSSYVEMFHVDSFGHFDYKIPWSSNAWGFHQSQSSFIQYKNAELQKLFKNILLLGKGPKSLDKNLLQEKCCPNQINKTKTLHRESFLYKVQKLSFKPNKFTSHFKGTSVIFFKASRTIFQISVISSGMSASE